MNEDSKREERRRLVQLIRRLAREEAYNVLDEHLSDYEHTQKPISEEDLQWTDWFFGLRSDP